VKPLHILVTDDDLDKRLLLGVTIGQSFPEASLFECYSGKEALDYFSANHVDVIVTNHNMPELTGMELIKEIRRRGSAVPIIMVTSHDEIIPQALAAGADLVLDTRDMLGIGKRIQDFLDQRGMT
jgi:two-component system chemotaxis response regulator CheY